MMGFKLEYQKPWRYTLYKFRCVARGRGQSFMWLWT
ncbi:unnamed protein product [Arabidopsis halleri]